MQATASALRPGQQPEFDVVAYDNVDLQPRSEVNQGDGDLVQVDPTKDGYYFYPFDVTAGMAAFFTTDSSGISVVPAADRC